MPEQTPAPTPPATPPVKPGQQDPSVPPATPTPDVEVPADADLVFNEDGTHVLVTAPNGEPWESPKDYLPFALKSGYTPVTPTTNQP